MKRQDKEKLEKWKGRLSRNETAYRLELDKMDGRERLYRGEADIRRILEGDDVKKTAHVRNICAELIEAQMDSSIPQPKVTARREGDEEKAKLIEDMLRNELDRMPFETLNDMAGRTVPIQGGCLYHVEWDNTARTAYTVGELAVSALHPKEIIPQDGVYSGIEDMDYIFLKVPQTKETIRQRYGVDVSDESEASPEVRSPDADATAQDMVTQVIAYYRNDKGGIGLYSWVNDTVLEDIEDYQARRLRRCAQCGATEPPEGSLTPLEPTKDGTWPGPEREKKPRSGKACPYCGGTRWETQNEDYEELWVPVLRSDRSEIPGAVARELPGEEIDPETGLLVPIVVMEPTRIPFYKPNKYPLILQKNVSVYGRFLGDSDIDKISDQQNTINRLEQNIIEKLLKNGTYLTLPDAARIQVDPKIGKVIRPGDLSEKAMIDKYDMEFPIQQDMAYMQSVYEEARQVIGVTDSFQGRRDATATSGLAKQFSAAQTAGRLESKRVMRDAAYAQLFELMFQFKLAYTDEPRPVVSDDIHGNREYKLFNRYDFLEMDEAGEWHWNDQFLFSCDTTAPLAANREAMWQETRMNLQTGAFGDPTQLTTLILFWTKMETLHYPGAGETRKYLEEELERQQAGAMAAAAAGAGGAGIPQPATAEPEGPDMTAPAAADSAALLERR